MTPNTRKALDIVYRGWSANPNLSREMDVLYSAVKRLAAYEASGMTPEEVQTMSDLKREGKLARLVCGTMKGGVKHAETNGI